MGKPEVFSPLAEQEAARVRAKSLSPSPVTTIHVRHVGGDVRPVEVEQATEDGVLHVRWAGGAGLYSIHVFKVIGERGAGHLFRTPRSRLPLPWQVTDVDAARDLWRRMTGRRDVLTREEWFKRRMQGRKP